MQISKSLPKSTASSTKANVYFFFGEKVAHLYYKKNFS